jgi:DnaJ-class molecular chaperone
MRDAFLGERGDADVLRAEVSLSQREALAGHVVALKVPVRITCPNCGGRGETWTEPCGLCRGTGESVVHQALRVSVPPRVADGACVRFRLKSPDATSIRVELRVAIRTSAA